MMNCKEKLNVKSGPILYMQAIICRMITSAEKIAFGNYCQITEISQDTNFFTPDWTRPFKNFPAQLLNDYDDEASKRMFKLNVFP